MFLPVVMLTAGDANVERIKGVEAGADGFLSKPPSHPELLARVRSLIRIKRLHDTVQAQMNQISEWNKTLETRVREQVAQLERLERLKRFFSPHLAELIVTGGPKILLRATAVQSVSYSSIFEGSPLLRKQTSRKKSWTCSGNTMLSWVR